MAMAVDIIRRRFTADEYQAMGQAGILGEDDRLELIDGDIVAMTPIGRRHVAMVNRLTRLFVGRLGDTAIVQPQGSLRLDLASEPQPDLAILRYRDDFYEAGDRPSMDDILLLIEVADTSLRYDLTVKAGLYARRGIGEYWVIDLAGDSVTRHTRPAAGAYRDIARVSPDAPFGAARLPHVAITMSDVFGPRR